VKRFFCPSLYADRTPRRFTPQIMRSVRTELNARAVSDSQRERMAVQYKSLPACSPVSRQEKSHVAPWEKPRTAEYAASQTPRRSPTTWTKRLEADSARVSEPTGPHETRCSGTIPGESSNDAVERHRFGIEWIRCPGTTRVMRVAELTVGREYPPSRDGVERHARTTSVNLRSDAR
jgi:hypothetical protein